MYVNTADFILNGQGHGEVGSMLGDIHFDTGLMRPYFDERGRSCVLVNTGRKETKKDSKGKLIVNSDGIPVRFPIYEKRLVSDLVSNHGMNKLVQNATVLSKEQWITLTNIIRGAYRKRLRAWSDLMAASSYGGFDGMSSMVLEYQTVSDAGEAVVDFDGMTEGRNDQPLFKLEGLPLPIIHSDFWFPERFLAISRKNGTRLNTRMAENAGRRVAEMVEKMLIGTVVGPNFGTQASGTAGIPYGRTPSVYGYLNHPSRIVKTNVTAPTAGGWTPNVLVDDVLALIDLLRDAGYYGPFMVYTSTDWDKYLDSDYYTGTGSALAPTSTLRRRLKEIGEVQDIRRLDFLDKATNPFTIIVVQMTSDVVQAVNGMDINTVQWPTMGGMRTNFKVMCIQVPLLTPNHDDDLGVAVGTTS